MVSQKSVRSQVVIMRRLEFSIDLVMSDYCHRPNSDLVFAAAAAAARVVSAIAWDAMSTLNDVFFFSPFERL